MVSRTKCWACMVSQDEVGRGQAEGELYCLHSPICSWEGVWCWSRAGPLLIKKLLLLGLWDDSQYLGTVARQTGYILAMHGYFLTWVAVGLTLG